jgi:hypothetical protein
MLLRDVVALWESINEYRQDMYELAMKKGFTDPQVIKISQQLDREIIILQKFMY